MTLQPFSLQRGKPGRQKFVANNSRIGGKSWFLGETIRMLTHVDSTIEPLIQTQIWLEMRSLILRKGQDMLTFKDNFVEK